ncbi:hypothetical protein P7C73_g3952, partial [Tremellales sp. Uapishka_1]
MPSINQYSYDSSKLPPIPTYVPTKPTSLDIKWADLTEIDLSKLHSSDPAVVDELVRTTARAIREDGFLYVTNYGMSLEQASTIELSTAASAYIAVRSTVNSPSANTASTTSPKKRRRDCSGILIWVIIKAISPVLRGEATVDDIEHMNYYAPQLKDLDLVPKCMHPYMDELRSFIQFASDSVNRRLMTLLSKILELPDEYLYENVQSKGDILGEGYLRHALYHAQPPEKGVGNGVRLYGHTDYGTTTMLWSVPVSALMVLSRDNDWRYVKYNPGALLVNLGEVLEVISAGHFKATLHRVVEPPADQLYDDRLSLILFQAVKGDLILKPIEDSPKIQRDGPVLNGTVFPAYKALVESGAEPPNQTEWRRVRIQGAQAHPKKLDESLGVKAQVETYAGMQIVTPV